MRKVTLEESCHKHMVNLYSNLDTEMSNLGVYYKFKLDERMAERNLTVRGLASLTGLRLSTISELMNGKKQAVNLHHLTILMMTLRIRDITEIVEIYIPDEIKSPMEQEAWNWKLTGEVPKETKRLAKIVHEGL